ECGNSQSNVVTITVVPLSEGGILADQVAGDTVEVFGIVSGTLDLSSEIGTINKWQYKTTGGWIDISNTSDSHDYVNITEPTYYRVEVQNQMCSVDYSTEVFLNVLAIPSVDLGVTSVVRPGFGTTISADNGHSNYEWFKDEVSQQNGTNNEFEVTEPGLYKVKVTSSGGAVYTTGFATIGSQLEENTNHTMVYDFTKPGMSDSTSLFSLSREDVKIMTSVYDGLGRPIQTIALESSPSGNDIVSAKIYDDFGRETKQLLPYISTNKNSAFKTDAISGNKQENFYSTEFNTIMSYSESKLEASPLGRVLEQAAPGDAWAMSTGKTVKMDYNLNAANEVRIWRITNDLPTSSGFYAAAELYKNTTTDEDGNQSIEFTNKQGQTVLKKAMVDTTASDTTWADTYYVYDIYNNLRTVLPPVLSANSPSSGSWSPPADSLKMLAFTYEYDGRNRMIAKQVPGADTVYMVYDKWDRLVLTQDGNQRDPATGAGTQWLFTKYDALNRPIITGIMTEIDPIATVRSTVGAQTTRFDTLNTSLSHGYSNDSYPSITGADILTVTYYDSYDFMNVSGEWPSGSNPGFDYFDEELEETVNSYTYEQDTIENTAIKGLVTGSKTRNLQSSGFINTVTYYDKKYRVIQTISTNVKGGYDRVSNLYDFIGQVLESKTVHYDSDTDPSPQEITRRFEYDHGGRLLKTYHDIDGEGEILLASNSYDELSQLSEKNLHAHDSQHMQSLDYAYNIRGWLKSINDSGLS
ncbi:MAG: DUF6443 domain-containing protein, partial [Cyclobacteriaceae bacterium]